MVMATATATSLFEKYRRTGDRRLRDRIVSEHVGLAYTAARRFRGHGTEFDDLCQVALLALVEAVERFDPARGAKFSTFATPTITGSLKRYLRDRTWHVRPGRALQDCSLVVSAAINTLTNELKRTPTVDEIASYSACTSNEVRMAMGATALRFAEQLPAFDDEQPTIDLAALDAELAGVEDRVMVDELLANLSDYERSVIEMRYFDDMLQAPIAERVGATQVQISRVLARSLTVLREAAS